MRLMSISSLFLVLLAGVLPAQDTDKVTIEWKFKKGDAYRYEFKMNNEMSMGGMDITQEIIMGQAYEVSDVDGDGAGTLKVTYDRIKFLMEGPMAADFDSDKDKKGEDLFSSIFGSMVGKSVTVKISRRGEILKVDGMAKLMDEIIDGLPEEHQAMAGMMKGQMSDEYAKSMFQNGFGFLPKDKVGKGESWDISTKSQIANLGKGDLKGKLTLKEIRDGKEAVIAQDLKMEFKADDAGGGGMGPMEMQPSKTTGELVWLVNEGRMKSSKTKTTMEFTAGGQDSEMTMTMEMKLAPREKPAPKSAEAKDPPPAPPKDK